MIENVTVLLAFACVLCAVFGVAAFFIERHERRMGGRR